MIKKLLLILTFIILINSCGYQPIYVNKDIKNIEFFEISLEGDKEINRKIINSLSIKKNEFDSELGELFIESVYTIDEISKNSKGQVISYRSKIEVGLMILCQFYIHVKYFFVFVGSKPSQAPGLHPLECMTVRLGQAFMVVKLFVMN